MNAMAKTGRAGSASPATSIIPRGGFVVGPGVGHHLRTAVHATPIVPCGVPVQQPSMVTVQHRTWRLLLVSAEWSRLSVDASSDEVLCRWSSPVHDGLGRKSSTYLWRVLHSLFFQNNR